MTHSASVAHRRYGKALAFARIFARVESLLTDPSRGPAWLRQSIAKRKAPAPATAASVSKEFSTEGLKGFAFFQILCHGDGSWAEAEQLNKDRAELIRVLRGSLGNKFQGGMYFDGPARPEFSDCKSDLPSSAGDGRN